MSEIIFNQTIELVKPREISSPYSTTPVLDWDNPVYLPVPFQVSVQPRGSSEGPVERPQTITHLVLITPPGTDIPDLGAESRIRVGGVMLLNVVGTPERWPDPWHPGVVHHLEASVEVVSG